MKRKLMTSSLAALLLGLLATGAQADWGRHGGHAYSQSRAYSQQLDARQALQTRRIEAGMRTGDLRRAEFRELMHEQRAIRRMETRFRADGVIDAREFRRLDRALDLASRNIFAERHDRQVRYADAHRYRFN
jgi:ribosomal protein L19E